MFTIDKRKNRMISSNVLSLYWLCDWGHFEIKYLETYEKLDNRRSKFKEIWRRWNKIMSFSRQHVLINARRNEIQPLSLMIVWSIKLLRISSIVLRLSIWDPSWDLFCHFDRSFAGICSILCLYYKRKFTKTCEFRNMKAKRMLPERSDRTSWR